MRWTGNGVADGTAVTTANVNTAGNGDAVTFSSTGTFTAVYGEGIEVTGAAGGIARLDLTFPTGKGAVGQFFYRPRQTPAGAPEQLFPFRSASATAGSIVHRTTGEITIQNSASVQNSAHYSPVVVLGHLYQIDAVAALSAAPTTSNGRMFFRVKDLTDPTWNGTGEFFVDTGYTYNLGTADLTNARVGRIANSSGALSTASAFSQIGWDAATVSTSLDPTVAKSHFMTAPSTNVAPTANAGVDQTGVEPWATVTLTGSDSDSDGTVTTRAWTQTGGAPLVTLTGTGAARTFEAPGTIAGTTLTFQYVATDNAGATTTDTMTVAVLPVTERAVIGGAEVPMRIRLT